MHKSKLIAYLSQLGQDEIIQLKHFINSPFFFKGHHPGLAIQLLEYLLPFYPHFTSDLLKKEVVFQYFYKDQAFNKLKVEVMMSRLFKIVEEFIVYQYRTVTEMDRQLALAKFYREKEMAHYQTLGLKKMQTLQNKIERKGGIFFQNQLSIAREMMYQESVFQLRNSDLHLPQLHNHLDAYYLVHKLEYACYLLAQNKHHVPIDLEDSLLALDRLQPLLDSGYFDEVLLIKLYYTVYLWLRNEKEPPENFIELLREYGSQIPIEQLKAIHALYRSYCVRKCNQGEQQFLIRLFNIYCLGLEEGLLLSKGGLNPSVIHTIVSTGLKLKKYDWVFQFLEDHKDKIVDSVCPHLVYTNNLARYYFELKEFDKAFDHLTLNNEDTYYKIATRLLEIKIYYEQRNDLLEYKMQAFKVYIHRISNTQLPALQKDGYRNFIDLLKQICLPRSLRNNKRINKLLQKLNQTQVIAEREWLANKLEELR